MGRNNFAQAIQDGLQANGELAFAGFHAATRYVLQSRCTDLDHAESRESEARIDPEDSQSTTAVVWTSWTSSRLSSASISLRMRPCRSAGKAVSLVVFQVISNSSGLRPAFSSAAFTLVKSAGAQISSTESSSFFNTSSAPASRPASITLSSLVPGAKMNWPQCLKR